jgi:hypothetical protein
MSIVSQVVARIVNVQGERVDDDGVDRLLAPGVFVCLVPTGYPKEGYHLAYCRMGTRDIRSLYAPIRCNEDSSALIEFPNLSKT